MQPSFMKHNPNDMTRLTNNMTSRTGGNNQDMSMLISDSTSRKAKGVISQLNRDQQKRPELVNLSNYDDDHFLSRDDTTMRSQALIRGAHNSLGMSGEGFRPQQDASILSNRPLNNSTANFARPPSSSRPGSGFRIKSAVQNPLRSSQGMSQSKLSVNPNAVIRNQGLNLDDQRDVSAHIKRLQDKEKAEKLKNYVESLVEQVEKMDSHAKDFKLYEKQELDAKDAEIKSWVNIQKKVDEERRVEVENRLRTIFQDKAIESTGYSPSEGFMLSIDFMYIVTLT